MPIDSTNFKQRLDTQYSDSTVIIQWRGSSLRKDESATLWPWIEYGGVFYYPPVCFRVDGKVEVPFCGMGGVTLRWVDPKSDMSVLCSNCHRMIHRRQNEVLTLEELRSLLQK